MHARARSRRRGVVVLSVLVALLGLDVPGVIAAPAGQPTTALPAPAGPFDPAYAVNASDDVDDGTCDFSHCSIREAILAANANPGEDDISIELFGSSTIGVATDLPTIDQDVSIEVIPTGCCGPSFVYLDGPGSGTGLDLTAGISRIDGLVVGDFETGIRIRANAGLSVVANGGTGFGEFGASLPNSGPGIVVEAPDVRIGPDPGFFTGDTVKVVNSGGAGIVVTGSAQRVRITGVEIHDNVGLGIDIDPAGPNPNDDDDLDSGPNGLQNAPVLTSVSTLASFTTVEGTLEGAPSTTYDLEFFTANACDPSGFGEAGPASSYTNSTTTDVNGVASFSLGIGAIGTSQAMTATATAPDGSTSEFSNCVPNTVILRADLNLALDDEVEVVGDGEPLRYTLTVRNDGPTNATGVTLEQDLPPGTTFGRATPSQGTCGEAAGTVSCSLGLLSNQMFLNTATVTVDVLLNGAGAATTSASVTAAEPDPDLLDNAATETTTVAAVIPATYTVTSPNDANDGICDAVHCSFREAILAANGNPGRDTIEFELPASNLIQPSSPGLPIITSPVVIDATTDADFAGSPVVELAGTNAIGWYGLRVAGGSSEIRGLILNRWSNPAVTLERWDGSAVAGNWFGLDSTGSVRTPNNSAAISVETSSNRIGGTSAADRNVISGSGSGVRIGHAANDGIRVHDNLVEGNHIGLNAAGTAAIFNLTGVVIVDAVDNVIGGTSPGAGNVISGSTQDGVSVADGGLGLHSEDNRIEGNVVGLNAAGTAAVPNQRGVSIHGLVDRTVVGGTAAGAGNTISGNSFEGVFVFSGAPDTLIAGNRIGTDPGGTLALPNGRRGIELASTRTTVGGTTSAAANVIAFNVGDGVLVNGAAAILGNRIHSNGQLGIDRLPDGVTAGSAGFTFPTLTSVVTHNATTTVSGTLASSANTVFRIELFDNAVCDPSGNGEGEAFVASRDVTTNGTGAATFAVELAAPLALGRVITATATTTGASPLNSEFSACRTNAAPTPESSGGSGTAGTTTTTDTEADGATPADPIETSVTVPAGGTSGSIQIDEDAVAGPPPVGFSFFGLQATITAPAQTAAQPLILVFTLDESAIPAGESAATIVVFRNSVAVPDCTAADGSATPDPCVALRETLADGDVRLTVRTSAASTWNFGVSTGQPPFPFSGFFSPVDNLPTLNKAKAGSAIPVKFSLGGDRGLAILATGFPTSTVTACDSTATIDGIEQTVNPGSAELTYDPLTDRYTYVWKTAKAWAGTCRQLVVGLSDGTFHRANFDFRK